ncbi:MAG: aminotransferase class V-fold PLP-dependent enzyme [Anaerolineaceae bacterium]
MSNLKREFLLDPSVIFLNHGSFGATPRSVFERYQRWQLELERQPVEFLGRRAGGLLKEAREGLAEYLGTKADNLVYVTNATTGLNMIARSLHLHAGDEVLTSDHEYGALDHTWQYLSQRDGFTYVRQPIPIPVTTVENFVETFWQGVTPRTKVIFLSHITSSTALIFPIAEICTRARQQGILTIIDGAHAPGQIPLSLDALGADFYSGNLHKWLCAPKGCAFLYARPEVQSLVEPLVVSWGWLPDQISPAPLIDYNEYLGTRDLASFLAAPDAIHFQQEHDWDHVRATCHQLVGEARQRINSLTGLPSIHNEDDRWWGQMDVARLPDSVDIDALKARLYDDYHVEIPLSEWNGFKLIRVSIQGYNTRADVDALLNALQKLL